MPCESGSEGEGGAGPTTESGSGRGDPDTELLVVPDPVVMSKRYPLHYSVFQGDIKRVSALLRTCDVTEQDVHGNTALHLAVMLGKKECVHLLLAHGAPVRVKNAAGWNPLAEAISYGDRQTITSLLRKLKQQSRQTLEEKRPELLQALQELGDFYLELKWDFHSWVPLVSRILPSDTCRIYKSGVCIRMDTTLVDFSDMRWQRGDLSFIFNGHLRPNVSLVVLDNELKVFQRIRCEETEMEIEEEVDILMSSDVVAAQMSTKAISFQRAQTGWVFREDKTESVGTFSADYYHIGGISLESRKRREHLSAEDLKKNKELLDSLSRGFFVENSCDQPCVRRESIQPPPPSPVSWDEYVTAPSGRWPHLGRPMVVKETRKSLKATVAMSEEFPIRLDRLLDVLEIIAPFKHFLKLREFVQLKLPSGFPVKIEIPVLPTITAKITFQDFQARDTQFYPQSFFQIPNNFKEDPNRFPDL
ncbi:ankyrin repeat domain-containing protein 13C-like isoform X1 [Branchiostoma lanceolatum]|uniref:ankyrin repeat domain-containing protein 13C-like isoform X1 n=1 Tax=Branchiostoma lanceolatum TaxID=7740 RepID=UPI003451877C